MSDNAASERTPSVVFGLVMKELVQYRELVHRIAAQPFVAGTEFTFGAPIFKGSDAIKEGLARANNALEKFDVYCNHAILDEAERVRFARLFAQNYVRRFPGSERSDLFLASGDVLKFTFELVVPTSLHDGGAALLAIQRTPHDPSVLADLLEGRAVDRAHLRGHVHVFLDHILNPRRHDVPSVQRAAAEIGAELPYVAELATDGALPGYILHAVRPLVFDVGARMVLLPG